MKKLLLALPILFLVVSCGKETVNLLNIDKNLKWGMSIEEVKKCYPSITTQTNINDKKAIDYTIKLRNNSNLSTIHYFSKEITIKKNNTKIKCYIIFNFKNKKLYSYSVNYLKGMTYQELFNSIVEKKGNPEKTTKKSVEFYGLDKVNKIENSWNDRVNTYIVHIEANKNTTEKSKKLLQEHNCFLFSSVTSPNK